MHPRMALSTICGVVLVSAILPAVSSVQTSTTTGPTTTTSSVCGTISLSASETPKLLSSSHYPLNLQEGWICSWTIEAKETEKVRVTVLACDKSSYGDQLAVFDGAGPRDYRMGDVCAGKKKLETFTSIGRYMRIEFNTSNKGMFELRYTSGNYHVHRHEEISDDNYSRSVISPLRQTRRENIRNVDLSWRLRTTATIIDLSMNLSSFQNSEGCVTDYIEVFDGYHVSDPSLGKWCRGEDVSVSSSGKYLYVKFHSDVNSPGSTFEIAYGFLFVCAFPVMVNRHPMMFGVIAGVLTLAVLILVCVCVLRSRKRRRSQASAEKGNAKGSDKASELKGPCVSAGSPGLPPSYDHAVASGPPTYQSLGLNPDDKVVV
ncbi:bone morphogenetic protein 1-like isoform X2 [Haliotis rubra]|uniref:bone morphogenetic protein 1-like isoform X2 n=1 Tax=Haliotis rubra TaxID=36100 RepID=UPI001EE5BDF1|nr:bone morphogenetic protein 1-like isoform X2 [Haliotis rubra]